MLYAYLCLQDDETTDHLLIRCEVTQKIWKEILKSLNISDTWMLSTLERIYFTGL
jgi:hypothetical protein